MSQTPAQGANAESPGPAARWIELAERMLACGRGLHDDLTRQAARCQLSGPEFCVLWACRKAPPTGFSQNQLSAVLTVSAARVSGLVERLRRSGLLEGYRAETDRRRQYWRLTPAGRDRVHAVLTGLSDWAGRLDEGLGAGRSGNLLRALTKLSEMLCAPLPMPPPTRSTHSPLPPESLHRDADRRGAA